MAPYRKVLRVLLVLVLLYLAVEGLRKAEEVNDFAVYYRAASAVRAGDSAYNSEIPGRPTLPYVYPPVLSSLLVPLATLPKAAASAVWTAMNLAALIGCLLLVRRLLAFHPDPVPVVIISFFLVLPFYRATLRSGQIDLILFWLMLLPFCPLPGRPLWRSDLPLGTAIAIKLYPAAAMLHWLVGRNWKRIGWVVAVTVVVTLLVPSVLIGPGRAVGEITFFWTDLTPRLAGWKDAPDWYGYRTHHSQSLPSALYRWTSERSDVSLRPGTAGVRFLSLGAASFWILNLLAAGFWIALACHGLRKVQQAVEGGLRQRHLLEAALVMGLIPILGPVSLKPSFITLLPVLAALLAVPAGSPYLQRISWFLAGSGLVLFLFPFRPLFGHRLAHWLEGHSDILIGTMLLYLALWLRAARFESRTREGRRVEKRGEPD